MNSATLMSNTSLLRVGQVLEIVILEEGSPINNLHLYCFLSSPTLDQLIKDFMVPRLGTSHDALNDAENLRRLTMRMVSCIGCGKTEQDMLRALQERSVEMNK